jgi:hypothetical protein
VGGVGGVGAVGVGVGDAAVGVVAVVAVVGFGEAVLVRFLPVPIVLVSVLYAMIDYQHCHRHMRAYEPSV